MAGGVSGEAAERLAGCAGGCASSRPSTRAGAVRCSSGASARRACATTPSGSGASTVPRASRCGGSGGSASSGPASPTRCRHSPTHAGRWTLCGTRSQMAGCSGRSPWWTTARASPVIEVGVSLGGTQVVAVLERLAQSRGRPARKPPSVEGRSSGGEWNSPTHRGGHRTPARLDSRIALAGLGSRKAAVRWRPEFDKRRRDRTIPVPRELADQVKALRLRLEVVGDGWLFPDKSGQGPWSRELFGQALRQAERTAGLPKLKGSLWHAYRRKWATERKGLPEADVMDAGAWQDRNTFHTCYQQSDEETVLRVMECPVKLVPRNFATAG